MSLKLPPVTKPHLSPNPTCTKPHLSPNRIPPVTKPNPTCHQTEPHLSPTSPVTKPNLHQTPPVAKPHLLLNPTCHLTPPVSNPPAVTLFHFAAILCRFRKTKLPATWTLGKMPATAYFSCDQAKVRLAIYHCPSGESTSVYSRLLF